MYSIFSCPYILANSSQKAAAAGEDPVDPLMPWFAEYCHAWPRAKQNPGSWIEETDHYLWAFNGTDTHACHPNQRMPNQYLATGDASLAYHHAPAPMVTAAAGSSIKCMFGSNGHSRGANAGNERDGGKVTVYWAGEPERELVDIKELNAETLVQENAFSEESFSYPNDVNIVSPAQGLFDKGNWQTLRL
jgi:hypothetical protein